MVLEDVTELYVSHRISAITLILANYSQRLHRQHHQDGQDPAQWEQHLHGKLTLPFSFSFALSTLICGTALTG